MDKTIKGQRLYDLIEGCVAIVVDFPDGNDGVIVSQLSFSDASATDNVDARMISGVGYIDDVKHDVIIGFTTTEDLEVNSVGQVVIGPSESKLLISLLDWVKVQPDGVDTYTFNMRQVPEWETPRNVDDIQHELVSTTAPLHEGFPLVKHYVDSIRRGLHIGAIGRAQIVSYVTEAILSVGNGSIEMDEMLQCHFPAEWARAQDAIAKRDGYDKSIGQ